MRAYAIRPYTCSIDFGYLWGCVMIPFSPTSGRMRYAPTPVRLIFGIGWVAGWFRFRSFEGVCDTPLHMFDCFLGLVGLGVGFVFAHIRAYAIRPYTCSIDFWDMLVCVFVSFSLTSGRMRYAPTHVRLLSWMNTVDNYTCSIVFWADNVMTKPPKRLRRC